MRAKWHHVGLEIEHEVVADDGNAMLALNDSKDRQRPTREAGSMLANRILGCPLLHAPCKMHVTSQHARSTLLLRLPSSDSRRKSQYQMSNTRALEHAAHALVRSTHGTT